MGGLGGDSCPVPISVDVTAGPPSPPSLPERPFHGLLVQNDLPGRTLAPPGPAPPHTQDAHLFVLLLLGGAGGWSPGTLPCPGQQAEMWQPGALGDGAAPQAWRLVC